MRLNHADILRIVDSLLMSEISSQRGVSADELDWPDDRAALPLGSAGLGLDSLELLAAATAVNRFFHLHEHGIEDYLLARRSLEQWSELVEQLGDLPRLSFTTSGSTGKPKHCVHQTADLLQEAHALAELTPARRILPLVPCHHLYGFLLTVATPMVSGAQVLSPQQARAALARDLRAGDLIIAFPLRWQHLAESGRRFPAGVAGVTSTAPCPAELIEQLQAQGLEHCLEIYGASETAGIGTRRSPRAPYSLLPYWQRSGDALHRQRPEGRADELILPQDRLEWSDERHFRPAGRRDGAAQVGGVNVFPSSVADALRRHPDVAECAVRLMNPAQGHRLKAFVVPKGAADGELRQRLQRWCREQLSAAERPQQFTFGSRLPLGPMGKPSDW